MTTVDITYPYYSYDNIYLTSSWNQWSLVPPTSSKGSHHFTWSVTLQPGAYQYKFVIEDFYGKRHWVYDAAQPNTSDNNGNWNNVLTVGKGHTGHHTSTYQLKALDSYDKNKNNFFITTAINYTNGPPHFGHAYEAIIADVIARYHKVAGKKVFFMTGTDEHGQKVSETAASVGLTPIQLCDKYVAQFRDLNSRLGVSEDYYIRTTYPHHIDTCQWLWKKSEDVGDIYLGQYEGWYNVREEKFVPESEAEKLDFKDPGSGKPLIKTSEASYFFRMSKYQQRLIDHIQQNPGFIFPEERESEVLARLKEPLLDLSISRTTFDWGVPCPVSVGGREKHVMYVWFDALTNYLTGINYPNGELAQFWPVDIHLIGKDIVWFHSVIWPCMLMSTGIPLPRRIICHGFILGPDGRKMSKSYNNVINPQDVLEQISSDNLRYFSVREGVFGNDFSYSEKSLIARHDAELADDLGNLIHRTFTLVTKWSDSKVPDHPYKELFSVQELKRKVEEKMLSYHLQQAFEDVLDCVKITNHYLHEISPWNLKDDASDDVRQICVRTALEAIYILAHFYYPVMPTSIGKIFSYLSLPPTTLDKINGWGNLTPGHSLQFSGEILFKKIQENRFEKKQKQQQQSQSKTQTESQTHEQPQPQSQEQKQQSKPQQKPQQQTKGKKAQPAATGSLKPLDISRLDLRVGKIVSCKKHESADHLYVELIDLGEEKPRQVVSGLAKFIPLEEMQQRLIVVVANLKAANFRGVQSQAMVIAATSASGTEVDLLNVPEGSRVGERISIEGHEGEPDAVVDSKKEDVVGGIKPDMVTDSEGRATYRGILWKTSVGTCTSKLFNAQLG